MPEKKKRARPSGQTLLELVAATTIITITLVPALRMMRDSLRLGRETETSNLLATLASSQLEQYLLLSAGQWGSVPTGGNWNTTTNSGSFTAQGYPNLKFTVVRTDSAPAGVPARLLSITATVWNDSDSDNVWDSGESRSVFASKLARNVAYSNEATGS
jgi:type II secretory pathway pseudopilin PulG